MLFLLTVAFASPPDQAAIAFPEDVETKFWIAQAQADVVGDRFEAIKGLHEVLRLQPENLQAVQVLSTHLAEIGHPEDAIKILQGLQHKYEKKMDMLREELELRRKNEIKEIEERKNKQIHTLMKNHEKAFGDIKNYYNDITHNNLDLIKSLKEEVADVRRREIQDEKAMETVRSPRFEVLRCLHFVDVTRI